MVLFPVTAPQEQCSCGSIQNKQIIYYPKKIQLSGHCTAGAKILHISVPGCSRFLYLFFVALFMSFSGDLKGFCNGSRVIAFKPNCYPISSNIFSSGRIGNCIVVCTDHPVVAVCNLYRWLFYFSIISIACSGKLYFFRIIDDLFILYTSAAALLLCVSVGSGGCLYCSL